MMEPAPPDTLIVRRLPEILTERDLNELFQYFGAQGVRKEKPTGRMRKSTVLVKFRNHEDASYALIRLHQLKVLDQRILVEYADFTFLPPIQPKVPPSTNTRLEGNKCPPANQSIVKNISSHLLNNPGFYEKVIKLMQVLNLPSPFTESDTAPSPEIEEVEMEELYKEETEESELETDTDDRMIPKERISCVQPTKRQEKLKKPRKLISVKLAPPPSGKLDSVKPAPISDVFEPSPGINISKKLEVRISAELPRIGNQSPQAGSSLAEGFGTFAPHPPAKDDDGVSGNPTGPPGDDDYQSTEFITLQKLQTHKLREEEIQLLPVFKNYSPGIPNSRLYIKNVAKTVRESDLKHIYGRYVTWTSEEECNMFDIRLMTEGRMKGQAFISLPSVNQAERALSETNGFMLQGKPLVVQFARSAPTSNNPTAVL